MKKKIALLVMGLLLILFLIYLGTVWYIFFVKGYLSPPDVWIENLSVSEGHIKLKGGLNDSALVVKKVNFKVEKDTVYISVYKGLQLKKGETGAINLDKQFENSDKQKIVLTGYNGRAKLLWANGFNFTNITALSVSGKEKANFDPNRYISCYKNELVITKGYKEGYLFNIENQSIKIKINDYGNFFYVDGVSGYIEIYESVIDEWNELVENITY